MNQAEALWITNSQMYVRDQNLPTVTKLAGTCRRRKWNSTVSWKDRYNAPCPYETKFPAILAKEDPFTKLVVWDSHTKVMHNGARDTLTEICSRFWITQGRQVVNKVISKCVTCKRIEGLRYNSAAHLIYLNFESRMKGRSVELEWISLVQCMFEIYIQRIAD